MTFSSSEATPGSSAKVSMFQIEFYQQFFDIDTMEVVNRIASSVIPKRAPASYMKTHLGVNPDLYGPFWVTVTLIFAIGISGNIARFFQHDHSSDFHFHYNFHLIASASTAIITYVCIMPIAIWGVLKWSVNTESDENLDLESVSF
jgi:protein YIPF1/2